jgi:transposase-like protein
MYLCRRIGSPGHHRSFVGKRMSPATVSALNKEMYGTIEGWRNRPIEAEHPYVFLCAPQAPGRNAGLKKVRLIISDACLGLAESVESSFPRRLGQDALYIRIATSSAT